MGVVGAARVTAAEGRARVEAERAMGAAARVTAAAARARVAAGSAASTGVLRAASMGASSP